MHISKKILTSVILAACLALPATSFATNGYFAHGYGTQNKGMAGAGAALSNDSIASATNPAAMVNVGDRLDIGAAIFNPNREYDNCTLAMGGCATASATSESDYFLVPHFGYNSMIDSDSSWGIAAYGNGGMNSNYKANVFGSGNTGVNLAQLFINTSYSRKMGDMGSWGVSLIAVYQKFQAKGLSPSFDGLSSDSTKLSDNGADTSTGIGARVGALFDVSSDVSIGVSYQPKIDMTEFDKYSGLFAENGDFDIPSTWVIGLAWKASPAMTVAFDVSQINYSDVAAISNSMSNLGDCPGGGGTDPESCLGGSRGAGFGWEDIMVYKLGVAYKASDSWTHRFGINHGENPIPKEESVFNILAPGVVRTHLTYGFTMKMADKSELNFAFMHALSETVKGSANVFGTSADITMDQNEVELSYGMKF